jgi:glycosyltransferase involved in cell wall biosynthesis
MNQPALKGAESLRIALFCANFAGVTDGASKTLNRLVAFLLEQGAAMRVYSAATEHAPGSTPVELVQVPSVAIPMRSEYRISLGLNHALREDVEAFGPTHVHISVPDLLGMQAQRLARRHGIPAIASMHTRFETYLAYYGLGFLQPIVERRMQRFYSGCDLVLVPNDLIAEEFRAKGWASNVQVWKRGVDRAQFSPGLRSEEWRRAQGFGEGDIVLLFFGRLVREKGIETFIAIVEELRRRGHALPVLVVGDGPERAQMQAQLPDAVFAGHLEGSALGRAVASADILINPSLTEAFGNVNLEAMASGLAIVSADVPSARALIVDGTSGLLVKPDEPEAYVEAVEQLIRDPIRRHTFGAAAASASAAFDWNALLGPVVELYLSLK